MSALLRMVPFVWRQLSRRPARLLFTALGVAVASFLVVGVESVTRGVRDATERDALDTRLIVYRANRFCPATSQIPQHFESRIAAIPGVDVAARPIGVSIGQPPPHANRVLPRC